MDARPLFQPLPRHELLREFERLHAQWREASQAADAIECRCGMERDEVQQLLEYRLAADRVHQRAMQLLRDTPL